MKKATVHLRQITPIVHFQAQEPGATLRASELKPKLDRYMIRFAYQNHLEEYQRFLINGKEAALDYRVSIRPSSPEAVEVMPLFKMIEGKNGKKDRKEFIGSLWGDERYGTFANGGVVLTLISRHNELIDALSDWLNAFFAVTNFGYRQSKGFGCFLPEKCCDIGAYEAALQKHLKAFAQQTGIQNVPALRFPLGSRQNDFMLNEIRDVWQSMKSGINPPSGRPSSYIPSYLMKKYAKEDQTLQHFDNEKKRMKTGILQRLPGVLSERSANQQITNERERKSHIGAIYRYEDTSLSAPENAEKKDARFLRAMLGLSSFVEFRGIRIRIGERIIVKTIRVDIANKNIQRFKSPITFKPVRTERECFCYLIPDELPEEMYGQKFTFGLHRDEEAAQSGRDQQPSLTISTPSKKEFNLIDFMSAMKRDGIQVPVNRKVSFEIINGEVRSNA